MELFTKIVAWIIFILLALYVYNSKNEKGVFRKNIRVVRRYWYLIYIFGVLIFATRDTYSLITNWKGYLIFLLLFVVIDALLFLDLYLSKFGGGELSKYQVGVTQDKLDSEVRKIHTVPGVLTNFNFRLYTGDKKKYTEGLKKLLDEYGNSQGFIISLIPYDQNKDGEEIFGPGNKWKKKAEKKLEDGEVFYTEDDTFAVSKYEIYENSYLVKVQPIAIACVVTEVDFSIISALILTYYWSVSIGKEE